jgi:hypothetical protein
MSALCTRCLYYDYYHPSRPRRLPTAPSVCYIGGWKYGNTTLSDALVIANDTAGRACTRHGESSTTRARATF